MKIINAIGHRLGKKKMGQRYVLKKRKGQGSKGPIKQRKGIVQQYTASVQQIDLTFRDTERMGSKDFTFYCGVCSEDIKF